MKVLAVGDIHTKIWIIEEVDKLLSKIDTKDGVATHRYDRVVFCGDYADDWRSDANDSINTWLRLMELQRKHGSRVKFVVGNHDYIYVNDTVTSQSGYNPITQLLINMPENKKVSDWLKSLKATLVLDGVTYSHAGVTDTYKEGDDLWQNDTPIWARPQTHRYKNIPQVFGHTPSETCWEVQPNVWCIDTFSTFPNGDPIGDYTMLEVINGQTFQKTKINDNSDTSGIESKLP